MNTPGEDDDILPTGKTVVPPENAESETHKVALPDSAVPTAPADPALTAPAVVHDPTPAALPDLDVVLQGSVAAVPLIDVLALLSRQAQSGVLDVESPATVDGVALQRRLHLVLVRGRLAQATGSGFAELRLGRFVMEQDGLTQEEIDALCDPGHNPQAGHARRHGPGPVLLGQRLCDVGYLSRDERRRALRRQTEELFYEALRLRHGRFRLRQPAALPQTAVDLGHGAALMLDIGTLLLEGYRRIHDWHLIEEDLTAGAMYLRVEKAGEAGPGQGPSIAEHEPPRLSLTDKEQRVLGQCSGHHGISEIAQSTNLPPLDVARILWRLQTAQLIRRRLPPAAVG